MLIYNSIEEQRSDLQRLNFKFCTKEITELYSIYTGNKLYIDFLIPMSGDQITDYIEFSFSKDEIITLFDLSNYFINNKIKHRLRFSWNHRFNFFENLKIRKLVKRYNELEECIELNF